MPNIFLIHGVAGYPEENWFPYIKKELEKLNNNVIIPQFPTPQDQTLTKWLEIITKYKKFITPETVFVGHSLGVAFILNLIEKHPIKAAFFVAGFVGKTGNQFDPSMKTFTMKNFNWTQIKKNCQKFTLFHSNNDPYVPRKKAEELAIYLNTNITLIKGAGHFNKASGYETFEKLLNDIKLSFTPKKP
ncbi:MAG: hypothetical protein UR27_C0007G0080 [Candidatus Peregrinibacteria bacterium GW2011_GWA2_33_10]|nr:MAG: hypothetical protein UR27_C0007G0080 [Candidatus Peregrinibacteria bacterium GW2011_GWA2_33_10]KKP40859.1 MAG: YdeN-like protein [Candidatus Peregrinibacteria bacterium GW2011_GWC2_33_13]